MNKPYYQTMSNNIGILLRNALKLSKNNPRKLFYILKLIKLQKFLSDTRAAHIRNNLFVPPVVFFSVTEACNLRCKGCFAAHNCVKKEALSIERIDKLFSEFEESGVSFVILIGGEPLIRKDILECAARHKNLIFALFTNGVLMDNKMKDFFQFSQNIIPIQSLEGDEFQTNDRRGSGVYGKVLGNIKGLETRKVIKGVSITVSKQNLSTLLDDNFYDNLILSGVDFFIFVDYIPFDKGSENLVLQENDRVLFALQLEKYKKRNRIMLSFPGDEYTIDGCLSAGRGFVHINAGGDMEPCPFSPYSDCNIRDMPFEDALKSKLFAEIRKHKHMLNESKGGCALFQNREWVEMLVNAGLSCNTDNKRLS